jgi:hypothetical protein
MILADYLGFFLSIILTGLLGRSVTSNSYASSILAGLCILGTILAITAWFTPLYSRQIVFIAFMIGLKNLPQNLGKSLPVPKECLEVLVFTAFFLVIFRHFSFHDYFYNNHDPAYWGFTFELLRADYFGPTKVPTFYPDSFSPTHILPQTALVPLLAFSKSPGLASIIEAKYLISAIFFGGFFHRLSKEIPIEKAILILGAMLMFVVYESELGYNLLISSYFYTFLLIEILILCLSKKPNEIELLFFSLILIIARGPIFYVASVMTIYYLYVFRKFRYNLIIILTSSAVFGVVITWASFPSALDRVCQDLTFNFMNPFDINQLITLTGIRAWALPDTIVGLLLKYSEDIYFPRLTDNPNSPDAYRAIISILPFMFYYIIKYYLPVAWALWFLNRSGSLSVTQRIKLRGIAVYAAISLVGWLFIRNGWQVAHQTHNYLLASVLSLFLLLVCCSVKPRNLFVMLPIALIF